MSHIQNCHDPYNLQRFVDAQNAVFEHVCKELQEGRKRTHWMWCIFPQLRGLGYSETAIKFAISSQKEAEDYLRHPLLGVRLNHCTGLVNLVQSRSIHEILGYPDDLKFKSSMTLFFKSTSDNWVFKDALQKYFGGELDSRTLELL
ncbi:MAG: hypothetical protein QOD84_1932 [Acidobacteriaceae bacterium]|jgi:uncharacterized protein (DUF1810 family)